MPNVVPVEPVRARPAILPDVGGAALKPAAKAAVASPVGMGGTPPPGQPGGPPAAGAPGAAGGATDPATVASIADVQRRHGLKIDGIIGPKTAAVLGDKDGDGNVDDPGKPGPPKPEDPTARKKDAAATSSVKPPTKKAAVPQTPAPPAAVREGVIWLEEARLSRARFEWKEALHPRDNHGKFRSSAGKLGDGEALELDSNVRVQKDAGGLRVVKGNRITKFDNDGDATRFALDQSAKSTADDSVGGKQSFRDYNAFLQSKGVNPNDSDRLGGRDVDAAGLAAEKTRLEARIRQVERKSDSSGAISEPEADRYEKRSLSTLKARLAEVEDKQTRAPKADGGAKKRPAIVVKGEDGPPKAGTTTRLAGGDDWRSKLSPAARRQVERQDEEIRRMGDRERTAKARQDEQVRRKAAGDLDRKRARDGAKVRAGDPKSNRQADGSLKPFSERNRGMRDTEEETLDQKRARRAATTPDPKIAKERSERIARSNAAAAADQAKLKRERAERDAAAARRGARGGVLDDTTGPAGKGVAVADDQLTKVAKGLGDADLRAVADQPGPEGPMVKAAKAELERRANAAGRTTKPDVRAERIRAEAKARNKAFEDSVAKANRPVPKPKPFETTLPDGTKLSGQRGTNQGTTSVMLDADSQKRFNALPTDKQREAFRSMTGASGVTGQLDADLAGAKRGDGKRDRKAPAGIKIQQGAQTPEQKAASQARRERRNADLAARGLSPDGRKKQTPEMRAEVPAVRSEVDAIEAELRQGKATSRAAAEERRRRAFEARQRAVATGDQALLSRASGTLRRATLAVQSFDAVSESADWLYA